jgi:hypothetical protein
MKPHKIILTFFTAFLLCVFSLNIFAQTEVTKEEYAIYATVLKSIYVDNFNENKTKLSFVIIDTTDKPDVVSDYKVNKIRGLLNSFNQRNQVSVKLDKSFPIKYRYEITNKSEIDRLLEIGRKEFDESQKKRKAPLPNGYSEIWGPFHNKYLGSYGYYQFSRVGFGTGKEFALVYVEHTASESGSWTNYVLRKKKNHWMIYLSYGGGWDA